MTKSLCKLCNVFYRQENGQLISEGGICWSAYLASANQRRAEPRTYTDDAEEQFAEEKMGQDIRL